MVEEKDNEKKISMLLDDLAFLESYSQELFSFAPLPLFFVSPLGVILEANPSLEKLTDKNIYEIIGEGIENFFDKQEINEIIKETLKKGSVSDRETFILNKKQEKIPVNIFSQVKKTKDGKSSGCFFGVFDLTEIKKKEESLKESKQVLEIRVLAKTKELRGLADELEERIKERTDELEEKVEELEKINRLMVGREIKMIELKEKLEKLENKLKK